MEEMGGIVKSLRINH